MIGSWITLNDPAVSEILCQCGFSWLAVDMQHSSLTDGEMQSHIRVIDMYGVQPWVRVAENSPIAIGKALDAGAAGVIVPQIILPAGAQRAVDSTRDPVRSTGLWRSRGYGQTSVVEEPKVVVQIEHIQAVAHIERIVGTEGVSGFLVGIYDLSASLGATGEFENPKFLQAMEIIDRFAATSDKLSGVHIPLPRNLDSLLQAKEKGYDFLALGMDTSFMWDSAINSLKEMK